MPLMWDQSKSMLIISPLKALQCNQELMKHTYQVILVGPEMCLEHNEFQQLLKLPGFTVTLMDTISKNLQIHPTELFFVNLGNDWLNITSSVMKIKSQQNYNTLLNLVATGVLGPSDLVKMIIFINSIQKMHEVLQFTHAKQQVMQQF
ncbi:hypothetical protein V8B97DRAFT_2025777 [Scleroderma yunnanense]